MLSVYGITPPAVKEKDHVFSRGLAMTEMIPNPEEYFRKFVPQRGQLLIALENDAREREIPIVGPVVGELLRFLVCVGRPGLVLELGTAIGYSTIYLALASAEYGGRVITVERDVALAQEAKTNFRRSGLDGSIELRIGEARDELCSFNQSVDCLFLDIDKEDYIHILPMCEHALRKGGLLVADNVGFKDADDFNSAVYGSLNFKTLHLFSFLPFHSPEHDGICFALRQ